jgi:hypothetical protein
MMLPESGDEKINTKTQKAETKKKKNNNNNNTFENLKKRKEMPLDDAETLLQQYRKTESDLQQTVVDDGRSSPRSSAGTTAEVRVQAIKQVDNSELYTKEALEREKLQGALEIEVEMRDLHSTYNSNVQDARESKNPPPCSGTLSSRDKLCMTLILVVLAVVVAVAVHFGTR